jgi:hypothetical protein
MRSGSSPTHAQKRARKPARGKAQGRIDPRLRRPGIGSQTGAKPRSRSSANAQGSEPGTRRKSIGAIARHERHVGPDRQRCRATRMREQTCEGRKSQERRRARNSGRKEDKIVRQGRVCRIGVAEHHAKKERWCMTRSDGTSEAVALEMVGSLLSARPVSPGEPAREIAGDGGRVIS